MTLALGRWMLDAAQQPGNDKLALQNAGVWLTGKNVAATIETFKAIIDGAANTYGINPNLIRAIIFEEQTKQFPPYIEDSVGGTTFGLGQMTEGYYGLSREQLKDPTISINAIARHLASLIAPNARALLDSSRFAASIGTFYNGADQPSISNYGRRIEYYFYLFSVLNR
jgi:hypothetical protein